MKTLAGDLAFKRQYSLGAVNSVNWARVVAQIVYYFHGAFAVQKMSGADRVRFCVPTGNFGDILAGWYAMRMGLPVSQLILATNENDILSRFFNSGRYSLGELHQTLSPAMDIQVASNFERFLFLHLNRDSDALRAFMDSFASGEEARLSGGAPLDDRIVATSVDKVTTLRTIAQTYRDTGYIVDPHTAVGVAAARRFESDGPVLCLATAHPAKFPESVDEAIGKPVARHPALEALKGATGRKTSLPADVAAVREFVEQHAL
jgi:threonine synthase